MAEAEMALPSPSGFRYAGEVLHGLVEAARRGEAGDPPDATRLAGLWRQVVAATERRASNNGDGAWLPLSESLDFLERTRLWAIRLASVQKVGRWTGGGGGGGFTERRLQSRDGLVSGRVDAIDVRDGRTVLRDFKSGDVADPSGRVKVEYATQMLLYGALFEEVEGRWPDRLELIDRRGKATEIQFSRDDARAALERARSLLVSIRSSVGDGGSMESLATLARPDSGECARCRHRPVCLPHLERLAAASVVRLGDHPYSPVDVIGQVETIDAAQDGRLTITLRSMQQSFSVQGLPSSNALPGQDGEKHGPPPAPGTLVGVFSLVPRHRAVDGSDQLHFVSCRATRAYRLPSGGGVF
jgi:hypothetical protein